MPASSRHCVKNPPGLLVLVLVLALESRQYRENEDEDEDEDESGLFTQSVPSAATKSIRREDFPGDELVRLHEVADFRWRKLTIHEQ